MSSEIAVKIRGVHHAFGSRQALADISLDVSARQIFALLGPNGGGKTTLFRLLATALPPQNGSIEILGFDVRRDLFEVRRRIGVVFQNPSLDKKLSVRENLIHHARLYGLSRSEYLPRMERSLDLVGLSDRSGERVEKLSGGLARRAELAQGLLHEPMLLILDEPSTGLDPAARSDLWKYLAILREEGVTVLVTTHLMEEAEHADQVGILDQGKLIALGTPEELKSAVGGEVVTIELADADETASLLRQRLGIESTVNGTELRFSHVGGYAGLAPVLDIVGARARRFTIARPTLEDVFLKETGHRFWGELSHD